MLKNSVFLNSGTRVVGWDIKQRAAVGENVVHLCFLNATGVHYDLAKMMINKYPCLVNDIYIGDEYYGEYTLRHVGGLSHLLWQCLVMDTAMNCEISLCRDFMVEL